MEQSSTNNESKRKIPTNGDVRELMNSEQEAEAIMFFNSDKRFKIKN